MQNSIFIAQESSRYLGFKKYTPYVKRIFFAFCVYKNVSRKKRFWYKNINNNDSHPWKIKCTFLYIQKAKKSRNVSIYIQKSIKNKTVCVAFLFIKIQTLHVTRFFMKIKKFAFICIQKAWYFALRDVFKCKNPDTSKNKEIFCNVGRGRGGGGGYEQKKMHFALNFYMQRKCTFRYV